MAYRFLDHTADMGVEAWGPTEGMAYGEAARALFALMVRPERVAAKVVRDFMIREETRELLLVAWLGRLLAERDLSNLVFSRFRVTVCEDPRGFELIGRAWGERIDARIHEPSSEVKGISLLGLSVKRSDAGWRIQYVADI